MNPEIPEDETRVDEAELIKKLETELGEPSPLNATMPNSPTRPVPPAQSEVTVGLDPRPVLAVQRQSRVTLKTSIGLLIASMVLGITAAAVYIYT